MHPATDNKTDFMIAGAGGYPELQIAIQPRVRCFRAIDSFEASPEDIIISKM